jgi:hypothetical protein
MTGRKSWNFAFSWNRFTLIVSPSFNGEIPLPVISKTFLPAFALIQHRAKNKFAVGDENAIKLIYLGVQDKMFWNTAS